MYKRVISEEDYQKFHQIKKAVWEENGFEMESAKAGSTCFLMIAEEGEAVGTVEFTPFAKVSDSMKNLFQDVLEEDMVAMELDSFAVLPNYRKKLGGEIVCLMVDFAEKHGFTHAIAIFQPAYLNSLQNRYGLEGKQVKEQFYYKGDNVAPGILNLKEMYTNKQDGRFSWYSEPVEQKEEVLAWGTSTY
ncbi:GNAT family N-acetyltransferase [Brevibacillus ginsengisoli]|uniref:GNAT family N-acetyltransferase n=1 Tax=Brevibacillus ginsengisoli TaxID=363854 RepID=UPI003CF95568